MQDTGNKRIRGEEGKGSENELRLWPNNKKRMIGQAPKITLGGVRK